MEAIIRDWLAPMTAILTDAAWSMPLMQAVHLLGVSLLLGSAVLFYPKLIRTQAAGGLTPADLSARLVPWVWVALAIILVSGSVLFIAEPARMMRSPFFQAKLLMVVAAVTVTAILQRRMERAATFADIVGSPAVLKSVAAVSLGLWITIAATGRLVGYGRRLINHFFG